MLPISLKIQPLPPRPVSTPPLGEPSHVAQANRSQGSFLRDGLIPYLPTMGPVSISGLNRFSPLHEVKENELSPVLRMATPQGEFLSPEHPIAQKLGQRFEELGLPPGVEICILDSETFVCHYDLKAKLIVISRQVIADLAKKLGDRFSPEHIDALISHEAEHAWEDHRGKLPNEKSSLADKLMSHFNHAEELRADREGMRRLARAGRNPMALVEALQSFGLTADHNGHSHPEMIDRIRCLENNLYDDETPLAHTSKPLEPPDSELLAWARGRTSAYDETDRLLAMGSEELMEELVRSKTIAEFWTRMDFLPLDSFQLRVSETFRRLLIESVGLPRDTADLLMDIFFANKRGDDWRAHIQSLDRDRLRLLIERIDRIDLRQTLRWSPLRATHQPSKMRPISPNVTFDPVCPSGGSDGTDRGTTALKHMAAWELYTRGYPAGYCTIKRPYLPPEQLKLDDQDWEIIVTSGLPWMEKEKAVRDDKRALRLFSEVGGDLSRLDDKTKERLKNLEGVFNDIGAEYLKDLFLVVKKGLADPETIQITLKGVVERSDYHELTKDQRRYLIRLLLRLYDLAKKSPVNKSDISNQPIALHHKTVASRIMTMGIQAGFPIDRVLTTCLERGIYVPLTQLSDEIKIALARLPEERLEVFRSALATCEDNNYHPSWKESLDILLYSPKEIRAEVITDLSPVTPPIPFILHLTKTITDPIDRVKRIETLLSPSPLRDEYLTALWEASDEADKGEMAELVAKRMQSPPETLLGRRSAFYDFSNHWKQKAGKGIFRRLFPDLLFRRKSIDPGVTHTAKSRSVRMFLEGLSETWGGPRQGFEALRLHRAEAEIFSDRSIEERISALLEVTPFPSIPRDIYLETLFRDELVKTPSDHEIIALGDRFLPLFTERSDLKTPFKVSYLEARFSVDSSCFENFEQGLSLILRHLPDPSLARNHFLNLLEARASLTPSDLQKLNTLRISPEGKKADQPNSPATFLVSRLNEMSRDERILFFQWLFGLSKEKPKTIRKLEKEFDGHADSFPAFFLALTPPERSLLIQRLCLGAEGILDLEAVPSAHRIEAEQQRRDFLERLADDVFQGARDPNQRNLFRKTFIHLLQQANPAKGTQLLGILTDAVVQARRKGSKVQIPDLVSALLQACGIVGKKAAQSLAEFDWLPEEFRKAFQISQTNAAIVPKRALLELAEAHGLIDGNVRGSAGLKILSFDQLIGAASNKQAVLLTIEVLDERITGFPKGIYRMVGKFKRPSAQKSVNLENDLNLLKSIIKVLGKDADSLPPGFIDGIRGPINRELIFEEEAQFAKTLRSDLKRRQGRTEYTVDIPQILFACDDLVIETVAPGVSLREIMDRSEGSTDLGKIAHSILQELLCQIFLTGNLHADPHPGNIFVESARRQITLIDLGMHERLTGLEQKAMLKLLVSLTLGHDEGVKGAFRQFGWDLSDRLKLRMGRFSANIEEILKISRLTKKLPDRLPGILNAVSKLTIYLDFLDYKSVLVLLKNLASDAFRS